MIKVIALSALAGALAGADGLHAEWFANDGLSGSPVFIEDGSVPTANWSSNSPSELLPADHFSAIWSGSLQAPAPGARTLVVGADDGVRLRVDGQLLIDDWSDHSFRTRTAVFDFPDHPVDISIEYYERGGDARIELAWLPVGGGVATPIPPELFRPIGTGAHPLGSGLRADYYANPGLAGVPAVTRVDGQVDFAWGASAPAAALPADGFSARWTGYVVPDASGLHGFRLGSDDGCRLWLDGRLLIDAWSDRPFAENPASAELVAGTRHAIEIEYRENAGLAACRLQWAPPGKAFATVGRTNLHPCIDGLLGRVPDSSWTSPASLWLSAPPGTQVLAAGISNPLRRLDDRRAVAEIALDPSAGTPVSVSSGSASLIGAISWRKLDAGSAPAELAMRAGDSLLLDALPGTTLEVGEACGGSAPWSGEDGPLVRRFAQAGTYSLTWRDAGGSVVAQTALTVVELRLPVAPAGFTAWKQLVGASEDLPTATALPSAGQVRILGTLPLWMSVAPGDGSTLAIHAAPACRGTQALVARLGDDGPLLGVVPVEAFELVRAEADRLRFIGTEQGFGSRQIMRGRLVMRPLVAGVSFDFTMFAHDGRFIDGRTTMRVVTGDPASSTGEAGFIPIPGQTASEVDGGFDYNILLPARESVSCYHVAIGVAP